MRRAFRILLLLSFLISGAAVYYLSYRSPGALRALWVDQFVRHYESNLAPRKLKPEQCEQILSRARGMIGRVQYDPAYLEIPFPEGDVPMDKGVCADVVVRGFRGIDLDLQKLVNEEMKTDFESSPRIWGLASPNPSIDHRRVPNLMWYLARNWSRRPLSGDFQDYRPCDLVAWDLGLGVTHIGIVSGKAANGEPLFIHHLSDVPTEESVLRRWRIIGHFAY